MPETLLRLLTIEEAAGFLAVSTRTIERLTRGGDLRMVYVGRLRRIPQADVEDYIGRATEHELESA